MELTTPHALGAKLLGDTIHRIRIAYALHVLHHEGARITIWRNGGPLRLGFPGQWHVRIQLPSGREVHVSRVGSHGGDVRDLRDTLAHAIEAVRT